MPALSSSSVAWRVSLPTVWLGSFSFSIVAWGVSSYSLWWPTTFDTTLDSTESRCQNYLLHTSTTVIFNNESTLTVEAKIINLE